MKLITMTACWRPSYTARVLRALLSCRGLEDYGILVYQDAPPEEPAPGVREGFLATAEILKNARRELDLQHVPHPFHLGCNANTLAVLDAGFRHVDYLIHLEDDVLLAPDALAYFDWAGRHYREHLRVWSVSAYSRDAYNPAWRHLLRTRLHFTPWGWATWRERWARVRPSLEAVHELTWDCQLIRRVCGEFQLREVYPSLSRSQNIGRRSAVHPEQFPPEFYDAEHRTPAFAGDHLYDDAAWRVGA